MRIPERPRFRSTGDSPESPETERWEVLPQPHRIARLSVAIVVIVLLVVVAIVVVFPSDIKDLFAPAPVWHSFSSVFDVSGTLVLESCSLENLQPIIGGLGGTVTPTSVVVCSYRGADYFGYYGTDCNLMPSGPIPVINGTKVPYDGCVLSTAPLNYMMIGIFTISNEPSNKSIQIWSNHKQIADISPTGNWTGSHCSLKPSNATVSVGTLRCTYLGIPFITSSVLTDCNLGAPIQVNGVPVPGGSCDLQRSEVVSG